VGEGIYRSGYVQQERNHYRLSQMVLYCSDKVDGQGIPCQFWRGLFSFPLMSQIYAD
jgi:hypothetical protein